MWAWLPHHSRWWVIVPIKDLRRAKSRISSSARVRRSLAVAMARDTLTAAVRATPVEGVLAVLGRSSDADLFDIPGVTVLARPGLDLNGSITSAEVAIRALHPDSHVAVVPADLPFLRPEELDAALTEATCYERMCVSDQDGTGTTLLTARRGARLSPSYGDGSAARHREGGAVQIYVPQRSGLRTDVDQLDSLYQDAVLGPRTRAAWRSIAADGGRRQTGRHARYLHQAEGWNR